MTKVFVTGIGLISSLGENIDEHLNHLREGITGIAKSTYFNSKYAEIFPFGEIKSSNERLLSLLCAENHSALTRTDLVAFYAFEQAIKDANITNLLSNKRTAFISSSTVGGMCETDQLYQDANLKHEASAFIVSYSGGSHVTKIAEHFQLKGFTNTINTACSSSANAIMMGTKMIKAGMIDCAIVGGADTLAKFTVNGFNALQILSAEACKPFDANRNGLTLGEAGAFLVLESEEKSKGKRKYAEIAGYGNTNDAFHASSLSEDAKGIVLSMSNALKSAQIQPEEIDYINTHGTATENNDYSELLGIQTIFKQIPPFNSTKSYTGHTLAAAGALEAIFSIFSINNSELYKSLQSAEAILPFDILPIQNYQNAYKIDTVLSNSFGFAGNCTSLILKKCI
jgi:3-oxoacyl-(acyl-carrier-protein) synthase